jgi:hypothetical protein
MFRVHSLGRILIPQDGAAFICIFECHSSLEVSRVRSVAEFQTLPRRFDPETETAVCNAEMDSCRSVPALTVMCGRNISRDRFLTILKLRMGRALCTNFPDGAAQSAEQFWTFVIR